MANFLLSKYGVQQQMCWQSRTDKREWTVVYKTASSIATAARALIAADRRGKLSLLADTCVYEFCTMTSKIINPNYLREFDIVVN